MSQVDDAQLRSVHLHSFSDASHAPYRFNNRKGVSGGAVFFERSLVRSLSRQQQALSLSSCEAELYGLQSVCQESVAFGRLVHRLLFALHEIDEPEEVVIWLESDSSSALQLVRSMDVQSSGTLSRVAVCIRQWKNSSCPPWVHIHASTPCGSGSPLRNFNPDSDTEKDQEWDEIINAIGGYFKHADSCSFELPERNTIWSRPDLRQ